MKNKYMKRARTSPLGIIDALCIVAATLVFGFAFYTIFLTTSTSAALVTGTQMHTITDTTRDQQQALLAQAQEAFVTMAAQSINESKETCDKKLSVLLQEHPQFLNFSMANPDGSVRCNGVTRSVNMSVADRLYFTRAMSSGKFSVGEFQIGRATKKPSINFGYPIKDGDGNITAVAIAALSLEWLGTAVQQVRLPAGAELTITDDKGVVLATHSNGRVGVPSEALTYDLDDLVKAEKKVALLKMRTPSGDVKYVAIAPVAIEGQEGFLHIMLSVPERNVIPIGMGAVVVALDASS